MRPQPAKEAAVDGIVLLKEDHKKVEALFKQFEKTKDTARPATLRTLVDKMINELVTHAHIEETIFYPAAKAGVPESGEHVLEAVEEHHVVAWLLSELLYMDAAEESFNAKVTVLIENVRHHVREEENEWFPEVRKALGRNRLVELAEQMQAARAKAPTDPLDLKAAGA
jgi:hemerythrin superfamily protein